ncbi:L-lactate permease [Elioraea sp.]|uniref:L-lactate permease n=1 Tax=Elioraea sp. TaxID=2185103 RepID=UPI0025C41996|nr:L-lactate permease [Elioraea sp.]
MAALGAFLPIAAILALMLGARWAAGPAGLVGLAIAVPVAILGFGWRGPVEAGGLVPALIGIGAEASFTALTILWIVLPALLLHEVQMGSGATETLRRALARLSDDPRVAALLIAWFFALFVEGAAGFGTPVALAAPLLVAVGFAPVQAVSLALIGHAVGVSFGAVGTPVLPQLAATGLSPRALAGMTAGLHAVLGWAMALIVYRLASAAGGKAGLVAPAIAAAAFLLPFVAIAVLVGPELPTLGGALIGGLVFAAWVRRRGDAVGQAAPSRRALVMAALPYLLLLAAILATRLLPPLREALAERTVAWSLAGGFGGSIQPLSHPGTLLMLGLALALMLRGERLAVVTDAAGRAGRRVPAVLLALLAMLGLARLMVHAGLVDVLADGAAALVGPAWPLLAPGAGVLGTFVTGSATASNILLSDFQRATAEALGLPLLPLTAAQGVGAAIGNIICPHNIVAGAATVGLVGRDTARVLRMTMPAALLYTALAGALVAALIALGRFG